MARARAIPPAPQPYRLGGIVRYDKQPPRGIRRYLWKKGVQIDAHLCFAMLEWWEALLIALMVLPVTLFFWYSCYAYFPGHIRYLSRRFAYYVYGDDSVDLVAGARAYVAEWVNLAWLWLCRVLGTSPRLEL
ncbi:hypothetical protein CC85DRAFT_286977 [Cutaneotrichosporon oleaginosum]|uniref:Uncharacterized protein n=1 Tax=Cutaneotrichosporon oleaginosum TaxID=879819 RepID=A0A0J1B036_9TREE|nr:uncharacterized protein CC85DRAFT_286977 [Cutaneotrichosporon oleaginosum]KLT40944.1 hypothetical protein CC85DRAFT_286977 [Cutaneotrichosporon oleaginosum]TXT15436.1 hypothetical protein COLE_01629 [Cutaneotrichosporon oleaginosum]